MVPSVSFAQGYQKSPRSSQGGDSDMPREQAEVKTKKEKLIRSEAGLNIPAWGVAIDAVYDNRLDNLIPGYKILHLILTNRSTGMIFLDPRKDRWSLRDNVGERHTATNHVRFISENLWAKLPKGLQDELDYPQVVRVGNSAKIDVFFPKNVELKNFREVFWESMHFKKEFNIFTTFEKNLDVEKESPTPTTPSNYQYLLQKYEGQPKANDDVTGQDGDRKNDQPKRAADPADDNFSLPMN